MTAPVIYFTVPGEPLSKERPRWGARHTYTPKRTAAAEVRVVDAFEFAYPLGEPLSGELRVRLDFYKGNRRRTDIDNLQKLVLDALNGVAYVDDWQVAELTSTRAYDKAHPRTEVTIWEKAA